MSDKDRLYKYRAILSTRRILSAKDLQARLHISTATLKRDIRDLRDEHGYPIKFDRDRGGYFLESDSSDGELPGLWLNQGEILALVTIQHMLDQLEPGLLGDKLKPFRERLNKLMEKSGLSSQDVSQRIRIVHAGKRTVTTKQFQAVAAATMARKRLKIKHFKRQDGSTLEREVSPQRLVHYRDNWYLDAWCHVRDGLRSFSVDAIAELQVLEAEAKEVTARSIDETFGVGYGIFGGTPKAVAALKFTRERARWVAKETWHPQQESHTEPDGSYILSVPYSDDREIVGDIMRFGADVQVLEPAELRAKVQRELLEAVGRYV